MLAFPPLRVLLPEILAAVLVGLPAITVAAAVTVFQRILKDAVDKKAGSDAKP